MRLPRGSVKTDWEVELGVVIGKRASYLDTDEEVRAAIAGYTLVNDVSEREFQNERGGQWVKGKSAETFNPAGPWLATPDGRELSTLDLYHGHPTLVCGERAERWEQAGRRLAERHGLHTHRLGGDLVDKENRWPGAHAVTGGGAVLVRPDGYVCARWPDEVSDPAGALGAALDRSLWRLPEPR